MKFLSSRDEYIHIAITRVMNFGREESATPDAPFTGLNVDGKLGEPRKVLFPPLPGTGEGSMNIAKEDAAYCVCQSDDILESLPPDTNFPIWIVMFANYVKNVDDATQLGKRVEADASYADPMWCTEMNHSQSE